MSAMNAAAKKAVAKKSPAKKQRKSVSKKESDAVLNEYNHMCAVCGHQRPQIHHIDENPSNNGPLNLLPLCPNHHLIDAHNPTQKIDHLKLSLFRKHRDPLILSPQFNPVFTRLRFLLEPLDELDESSLGNGLNDLIRFTARLQMGSYYEVVFRELTAWPQPAAHPEAEHTKVMAEHFIRYRQQVANASKRIIELVVEQLRYQNWPLPLAIK